MNNTIFFVILRNETILLLFFNGKVLDMFPPIKTYLNTLIMFIGLLF